MPRPKGRETSPEQLLTWWTDYVAKCKKGRHAPTLTGERGFVKETGRHKDTVVNLIKVFGLGPLPLIYPGGFTFLLEPEPPHDIIWSSDPTYDLQERTTFDLRPHVGTRWAGYVGMPDFHRMPVELDLRRGFDAVPFLTLKVQPIGQPSFLNEIAHGARSHPHRIKTLAALAAEHRLLTAEHVGVGVDLQSLDKLYVAQDFSIGELEHVIPTLPGFDRVYISSALNSHLANTLGVNLSRHDSG